MTTPLPSQITPIDHAGHACLRINTRHGTAILALFGAHLLSWVPTGQRDVLWVSPNALPEPAAIRGGVPVCWPWFAKQGVPTSARQHGVVRNVTWAVDAIHHSTDESVSLTLNPVLTGLDLAELSAAAPGMKTSMTLTVSDVLTQTLHTWNGGTTPFTLSQALHSYFAVGDALQTGIEGLTGLPYDDRLRNLARDVQQTPFVLIDACDRTYQQTDGQPQHSYTLVDPVWQRRIQIDTTGSQSVVVWNPGHERSCTVVDLPDDGWHGFFCVETTNAGPDVVLLAPGAEHRLTHTLRVTS
jgi:glucose-6-phosphate 1-epimerase